MNINTGELVDFNKLDKEKIKDMMKDPAFQEVPDILKEQATKDLDGEPETIASDELMGQMGRLNESMRIAKNESKKVKSRRSRV